jgi:dTDP-4-dehydrorhamnose reductase
MKIFVTGPNGNVGRELLKLGCDPMRVDVTSRWKVKTALKLLKPDLIIHCAAFTDVDLAEVDYKPVHHVNVDGTARLRMAWDGPMIYISSDHIFRGEQGPYSEKARPGPVNTYGMTKMAGEAAMDVAENPNPQDKIVRASTLFGGLQDVKFWGSYFALRRGEEITKTAVIYRSFLWITHFAECLMDLTTKLESTPRVLNISGTKVMNYSSFAREICDVWGFDRSLVKIRKKKLKDATPRPYKGGLKVRLAQKHDIPVKSAREGLEAIRNNIVGGSQ